MLSNSDTAIAEKMGALIFPETSKKETPAVQAEPETPQETHEAEPETEIEQDEPVTDGAEETGDADDGEEDAGREIDLEPQVPAIDPPSGLTADEKALFSTLPAAAQQAWARRERDRTTELHRLQSDSAENRKKFDAAMAQVNQERQQLAAQIQQYGDSLSQEFQQKFGDVTDPVQLAQTDPARYLEWQATVAKLQHAHQQRQMMAQHQEAQAQENRKNYRIQQNNELRELIPALKDNAAFDKFDNETTAFLRQEGFPDHEIMGASAKSLAIVSDAMKWRNAQASRKTQEAKVANVPKVMKPGVKRDVDAKAERATKHRQELRKTGTVDAFAAAIRDQL